MTITAASAVSATFSPVVVANLQSINHIIIFAQENRSFDHYFGALRQYWAQNGFPDQSFDGLPQLNPTSGAAPLQGPTPSIEGCNPAYPYIPPVPPSKVGQNLTCIADTSVQIASFHAGSVCTEEPSAYWNQAHLDWDLNDPTGQSPAALNGFVVQAADYARESTPARNDTNGLRAMEYFDGSDLNFYYYMASNFATSDRWFTPIMDRTENNRMFLLSASSGGHVNLIAPPYGPLSNTTIFEALQNAGVTWKIYVNSDGTGCADSDSACLINHSYINMFAYYSTILNSSTLLQNIASVDQYKTDVANGTLPQVSLIEPASDAGLDEHPSDTDQYPENVQAGANYAEGLINALMTSPSWKDSAMIFTYDEYGGFYDHVSPQPATPPDNPGSPTYLPIDIQPGALCDGSGKLGTGTCNFAYTGYRVPFIVISPFAKKNYVSHTVYDHTAILKLIEERFGLSALTNRDAAQADMSADFFDFASVPWSTPPNPPAQVTTGSCSLAAPTP